ncbi:hypothetical protein DFH08DRAFT_809371 [Mycena albidolilacea]|uniref:Uncharacterized protein n=1 Tax=Mycena albidolilacea TaxID=1033008 RepID=A0AAD6ZZ96_9AGAR|nr:hypothetical protein DFH08DRAFT_809371 [Mycena albidolilacea]
MLLQQSQQSRNTYISREMSTDSFNDHIARLQDKIEEHRESIFAGMSQEAVEQANEDPEYLRYLCDLIELEGKADVADENLRIAQANMMEATTHRNQIAELRQCFEWGDVKPTHFVNAVDLLCRQVSPDADDIPDEKLDSGDESEGGEEAEEPEEVGKKRKSKGKAKAEPKKVRNMRSGMAPQLVVKSAPTATFRALYCRGRRHATAATSCMSSEGTLRCASNGWEDAAVHRPVSQVFSRCRQVDFHPGELLPGEMSYFEEMRLGLVNAQHRLRELKQREKECEQKKQQKRAALAVQTAGDQPQEDTGPTHSECCRPTRSRCGPAVRSAPRKQLIWSG